MDEQPQQPIAENQAVQATQQAPGVVSPVVPTQKKGPGLVWIVVILMVGVIGVGAVILYSMQPKLEEKTSVSTPGLMTQEAKTGTGFGTQPSTPTTATPTITSGDTVTDIGKDLSGTTLEAGSTTDFDADLQSL
jgi:hypothetical protein